MSDRVRDKSNMHIAYGGMRMTPPPMYDPKISVTTGSGLPPYYILYRGVNTLCGRKEHKSILQHSAIHTHHLHTLV